METVRFRHAHFSARFPVGYRYSPSHFWLLPVDETDVVTLSSPAVEVASSAAGRPAISNPEPARLWRVGMTKFATRMLGELVEMVLDVAPGSPVQAGGRLGTVEGFKAVSDLFCAVDGEFVGSNPLLGTEACLTHSDPYGQGWLYAVRGWPEPGTLDVHGYSALLTATIDRLHSSRYSGGAAEQGGPDAAGLSEQAAF